MSPKVQAWALLVAALVWASLTAWFWTGMVRNDARADRAESTLEHVLRGCDQRADGSAVCAPRTFTPLTTVAP